MFFQDDASTCSDESAGEIFKSIPKGRTAFCIWKIEVYRCGLYRVNCPPSWIRVATKTISLGRAKLGTFFTDSAYLIYAVSAKDGPLPYPGMPAKDLKDCQSLRAIHFWVGEDCEADTSGAAALRAVELDSQLACAVYNNSSSSSNNNNNNNDRSASSTQSSVACGAHLLMREAQGRESPRFLGYFRHREFLTVEYPLHDGDDGSSCCRLHRVSGTSIAVLTELRPVDWASFSSHDVILLDVPSRSVIFLWLGSTCEPLHKRHAARLIDELLKLKQPNQPRVLVLEDGYEQTLQLEARRVFDEILEPARRYVSPEPVQQFHCSERSVIKFKKCEKMTKKTGRQSTALGEPEAVQVQRPGRQVQGRGGQERAGVAQRARVRLGVSAGARRGRRLGLGGPTGQAQGAPRGGAQRPGLRQEEGLQAERAGSQGPRGPRAHGAALLVKNAAATAEQRQTRERQNEPAKTQTAGAASELRSGLHGRTSEDGRGVSAGRRRHVPRAKPVGRRRQDRIGSSRARPGHLLRRVVLRAPIQVRIRQARQNHS
ncbi:unnamed protein product [Trichogramma brassicae]|uniref:Gelsolin-like domain-containing protein n=1 Tax=Trichogramma brassicae TaxID=86971 RepID=A0A6H5I734_9HYME|nr:unnamed protein product [Trichogramma brassicae]